MRPPLRATAAALLLAAALAACGAPRAETAPARPGAAVVPDAAALVDDHLTRLSGYGYSGATLVAVGGRVVLREGYGAANDSTGARVTPETVFDIGSLAKTFTAAAVLLLEERGRLALDDSLGRFLDGVPAGKRAITLRQLLSHTSGLDADFPFENPTAEDYEEVSREEALRRIFEMPPAAPPGSRFLYSNPGYILLAAVVERASGRPFRDFLREEIFGPAGMRRTGFWGDGLPPVGDEALARSYDERGQTGDLRLRSGTTWFDLGGGEMVSTADDLHRWARALLDGRVLGREAVRRLWTPGEGGYALGWYADTTARGTRRVRHGGDYVGFGAELAIYPDDGVVVVNLANRRFSLLGTRYAADQVIPRIVFGEPPRVFEGDAFDPPPAWATACERCLDRFEGVYRLPEGGRLVVRRRGDALEAAAAGQEGVDLLSPAPAAELEERRRLTERSLEVIRGAARGDTAALLAAVGPERVSAYRRSISRRLTAHGMGALRDMVPVATAPAAFPRGSRVSVLRVEYERGRDVMAIAWVRGRIRYMSVSDTLLAPTPLRSAPPGDGAALVGWNFVPFRALRVTPHPASGPVRALEIESGGRRVRAERALP
ncbi:MAG TPA: serine hydrolase domain-containing protein [Longimicrobium sp.]|nr:serine hydrolase domain-containing protein [Longimicrobium sp.]